MDRQIEDIPPPKADFSAPPPYELEDTTAQQQQITSKPPTYEEVEMEKSRQGEPLGIPIQYHLPPPSLPALPNPTSGHPVRGHGHGQAASNGLTFIAIDNDTDTMPSESSLLGTDVMFVTAFIIAFLFNWIGFLILTCFCHTIAARYGALSGFGLSLAKWTLIVKHSTELGSHENSWLWWLIMAFGFLICARALIQYVTIKRTWRLLSTAAQERLLFFY